MTVCSVCGNHFSGGGRCPFCGRDQGGIDKPPAVRTIDLERDRPTVNQALQRLLAAVTDARAQGIRRLKIIHGYGSSGQGGAIRQAVRTALRRPPLRSLIRNVIPGEKDKPPNPGITWIELR